MENGYFITPNGKIDADSIKTLDLLIASFGGKDTKLFDTIGSFYTVLKIEAADELSKKGYVVELENVFHALEFPASGPSAHYLGKIKPPQ